MQKLNRNTPLQSHLPGVHLSVLPVITNLIAYGPFHNFIEKDGEAVMFQTMA
jgi:hypothetical protein